MTSEPLTQALARRFLLGEVDDAQREMIERRFMGDAETKMTLLLAEEELIEDYLEDNLPASERDIFLKQYAATPRQRRNLRIQTSIRDWAATEDRLKSHNVVRDKPSRSWFSLASKNRWRFAAAFAAVSVVLIAVGYFWRLNKQSTESARHLSIQQELIRVNSRDSVENSQNGAKTYYATLAPGSLRSVQRQLTIPSDSQVVEFQLLWTESAVYPSYQAVVRRVGSGEQFTISGLLPDKDPRNGIRLRLPKTLLTPALYQISLQGVGTDAGMSNTEEYAVTVNN